MRRYFILFSLCIFLKSHAISAVESGSLVTLGTGTDLRLLSEMKAAKFLIYIEGQSKQEAEETKARLKQVLKPFGQVILKPSSVQSLMLDKPLLNSPSLICQIHSLCDVKGASLPFFEVSLSLETAVEVAFNRDYGQGLLWNKTCFLPKESESNLGALLGTALPILLQEFEKERSATSDRKSTPFVFYVIE